MKQETYERLNGLACDAFDEAYKEEIKAALHEYYHTVQTADDFRKRCEKIQKKAIDLLEN